MIMMRCTRATYREAVANSRLNDSRRRLNFKAGMANLVKGIPEVCLDIFLHRAPALQHAIMLERGLVPLRNDAGHCDCIGRRTDTSFVTSKPTHKELYTSV